MFVFIIILSILSFKINAQTSPCPKVFKYFHTGLRSYAIITVPPLQEGLNVLSISVGSNGNVHNTDRYLRLSKTKDKVIKDSLEGMDIEYALLLPEGEEMPAAKSVILNNRSLCAGANEFYQNNWSFKHSFLFSKDGPRSEHSSNTEDIYPRFSDWLYSQPKEVNFFLSNVRINQRIADNSIWLKDLPFKCGVRPPAMETSFHLAPLILNGTAVLEGEFPWLAYLEYEDRLTICGGTLVSDKLLVTAAHCVQDIKILGIQLGKHNRRFNEKFSIRRQPKDIIIHPNYKTNEADADIALISFDPVQISNRIFPACIWPFGLGFDSLKGFSIGTVAGWGVFENDGPSSDTPMKTALPVVNLEVCRKSEYFTKLATDKTICAGGEYSGPCFGDSGSGFYFRHNNTWYLRGVVSIALRDKSTNFCQTDHYAVYVDLAFYLDWIKPYLEENEVQIDIRARANTNFKPHNEATIQIKP